MRAEAGAGRTASNTWRKWDTICQALFSEDAEERTKFVNTGEGHDAACGSQGFC